MIFRFTISTNILKGATDMEMGTLFYITDKPDDDIIIFDKISLRDVLDKTGADYAERKNISHSAHMVDALRRVMISKGARIIYDVIGDFSFGFTIDHLEKFQQEHFEPMLAKLKEKVAGLQLFDVIRSVPELNDILNRKHDDYVIMTDEDMTEIVTWDDFIRRLKPGKEYFVLSETMYLR